MLSGERLVSRWLYCHMHCFLFFIHTVLQLFGICLSASKSAQMRRRLLAGAGSCDIHVSQTGAGDITLITYPEEARSIPVPGRGGEVSMKFIKGDILHVVLYTNILGDTHFLVK